MLHLGALGGVAFLESQGECPPPCDILCPLEPKRFYLSFLTKWPMSNSIPNYRGSSSAQGVRTPRTPAQPANIPYIPVLVNIII